MAALAQDIVKSIALRGISLPMGNPATLVLLGYEPHEEMPSSNWLGKPGFRRPGYFPYMKYLYRTDGWRGLFKGFVPSSINAVVATIAAKQLTNKLQPVILKYFPGATTAGGAIGAAADQPSTVGSIVSDIISVSIIATLAQPMRVVHNRMLAAMVGEDAGYATFTLATSTIFRREGVAGFFSGISARLASETIKVLVIAAVAFALKESGIVRSLMEKIMPPNDKKVDQGAMASMYERLLASTLGYAFFHPFVVVSEVMTINGADLALAQEPYNLTYSSWTDCFRVLHSLGGFRNKRGLARALQLTRFFKTPQPTTVSHRLVNM